MKSDAGSYRYAYQGQFSERDLETGWTHFELREYDPVIGRWLVPDPMGVHWSPYLAMNNDPVSSVDPDGGCENGDCDDPVTVTLQLDENNSAYYLFSELVITPEAAELAESIEANIDVAQFNYRETAGKFFMGYPDYIGQNATDRAISQFNQPPAFGTIDPDYTLESLAIPLFRFGRGVGAAKAAPSGAQYSVAFEMKLANNLYPGKGYFTHFKAANTSLSSAMISDATFANSMSRLGISIPRSSTGAILGKSPAGWVWHHDVGAGVMQLVPKVQHTTGSIFWNTLHPGGAGGMSIWGR